jgi:dolichol-phosphate mannosyltransferase
MSEVIVLIPAKNEEKGIKQTIIDVKEKIAPDSIFVVDGHSEDKTVEIAKKQGATAIIQKGRGKGAGVLTFIESTMNLPKETIVVMTDADSTYGLDNVKEQLLLTDRYGMIVGSRFKGKIEKGAMNLLHRFGNFFFAALVTILTFHKVTDLLTGLRIFTLDSLRKMDLTAGGFEIETDMTMKCLKKKMGYKEFPCDYYNRLGKSNLNAFRDGLFILKHIIKEVFSKK